MFIAHLPAAYVALKATPLKPTPIAFAVFLAGSVAPDLDLAYFYLLDGQQHHHHGYLTHRPAFWIALLLIGLAMSHSRFRAATTALSAGALLHLLLDSIVAQISWLWPLSDWSAPVVSVPATHEFWVLSFLTHWTFKIEIVICLIAAATYWRAVWRTQKTRLNEPGF